MTGKKKRSAFTILVSGLIGLILFLVLLIVMRMIANHYQSPLLTGFVDFLYANLVLIIAFSVLFMIGEVIETFAFPYNLPFPAFNAFASVLLVLFLIRMLEFFDIYFTLSISSAIAILQWLLYPLVFIVVIVTGYLSIFKKPPEERPDTGSPEPAPGGGPASWEDVGSEFRQMLYDFFRRIREELKGK
jgi:hypothetical protein